MTQESKSLGDILSASQTNGLSLIDTTPFLNETFDPQEYANNIIEAPNPAQGEGSGQGAKASANWSMKAGRKDLDVEGDVSVALSRLNLAIDDVDRLIREEVTTHANDLLTHTTTLLALRPTLSVLIDSLRALQDHQNKLVERVSQPRATLAVHTSRLAKLRSAQSLVKRSERLLRLVRRLQGQMKSLSIGEKKTDERNRLGKLDEAEGEADGVDGIAEDDVLDADFGEERSRGLSRAALTLSEIGSLIEPHQSGAVARLTDDGAGQDEPSGTLLAQLDFVKELMPVIDEAREKVTDMMEDMVVRGLRDLSPTLLSTSLQTAFNLGQLADLVRDLLADLNDVIRDRVAAAFDMQNLAKEMGGREPLLHQATNYSSYKSRRGQGQGESTVQTAQTQRWTNALWARLETLVVGEMGAVCSKVNTLERVLSLKTDRLTGRNYLDEAMSVLGDRPSAIFWSTLGEALEKQSRHWTKTSSFLASALASSYPRLLRLFHDFFDKVAIYDETVNYSSATQSQEVSIVLGALNHLQESYLSRFKSKMDAFLTSSFSPQRTGNAQEGSAAARMAAEELDRARFDTHLLRSTTQMVHAWLTALLATIAELRSRDPSAFSLQRSATSPTQMTNASLTNAIFTLNKGLSKYIEQGPEECRSSMTAIVGQIETLYHHDFIEPMIQAVNKEISDTIARMHYGDFGLSQDDVMGGSSGSAYMSDLSDRLWYIREQLLVHYTVENEKTSWILRIAKHALRTFVVHASLVRPLGEGGKLKMTSDMTELEFGISQLLASAGTSPIPSMSDCGEDFKALRSFRALLFKDDVPQSLSDLLPSQTGLAPHEVAHHIIVRSKSILLPHELHRWSRIEYLKWLDSHRDDLDTLQLLQGCLDSREADEENTLDDEEAIWLRCLRDWLTLMQSETPSKIVH